MKKRASRPPRFVAVDNRAVDTIHSVLAVGLLTILARARDGDDVTVEGISKARKEGREALSGAMRALVQDGYVVKLKIQLQDGIWNEDGGKWEIRAGGWITEFNADTIPFTREDVAEMLAETENARAIRVEPEWLDPRDESDTTPPAKPKNKARLVRKPQPKPDPEQPQHDRPTETRNSVVTRQNNASSQVAPTDGFPAAGEPTAGEPTAGNAAALYRKKTSLQDSLSSDSSSDTGVSGERETSAVPNSTASASPADVGPDAAADAWVAARQRLGRPVPPAGPAAVRRNAGRAIEAGLAPHDVIAAAADMASDDRFRDPAKHLEHWAPPVSAVPGPRRDGRAAGHPLPDCPDCYGSGWTEDLSDRCHCMLQPAAS
ncbi:hypothetical protein [Streptomyces sp. NPDC051993]|uniref:hypothetical protein n=1 Tax=Streptomyces sp. NPDC051993 TaxID=3155286 RepID=UPI00343C47BB